MRRIIMLGIFMALSAAVYFLWQVRFERSDEISTLKLDNLRTVGNPSKSVIWVDSEIGPRIRLTRKQGDAPVVARYEFPGFEAIDYLHLKFRVSAEDLVPGPEIWENGRFIIEWHQQGQDSVWQNSQFCSVRHDQGGEASEVIIKPNHSPSRPALRLENLGQSGIMEMSRFEATVVHERWIWKFGKWLLVGAWLTWAFACIRMIEPSGIIRPLLVAAIWVTLGVQFVVPGPWNGFRSLGGPFDISSGIHDPGIQVPVRSMSGNSSINAASPIASVGKIPETGGIALMVKIHAQKARPFLHLALLFAPAFVFALLVGLRPALVLTVIFALAIEVAQISFGFGFDSGDVLDLVCDAVGIALGLWSWKWVSGKFSEIKFLQEMRNVWNPSTSPESS